MVGRWRYAGSTRRTTTRWPSGRAVLRASDEDLWPELTGFTLPDIRAFARFRSASKRFELLAAREPGGPMLGVG